MPRPLCPQERPGTHCIGGSPPPGFDRRPVQPVASRYTYYAILAHDRNEYYEYRPTPYFMRGKGWQHHNLLVPVVWVSGSPNLLEPSGPFHARPLRDCQSLSFPERRSTGLPAEYAALCIVSPCKSLIFRRINSKPSSPCMIRDGIDTGHNMVVRICGVKKQCNIKGNILSKEK